MILPDWDRELHPAGPHWSEEAYLELVALNLDDVDAILAFIWTYGPLGMRSGRSSNNRLGLAGLTYLAAADQVAEELSAEHLQIADAEGVHVEAGETLSEFRWGALCIRDMVSAWRIVQGELDAETHRWEAPVWKSATHPADDLPWLTPDGASVLLTSGLSDGLESFVPVVRSIREAERFPVFEEVWAYELCCLELFNHIVEQATYRSCANETCGRLFVRQRGRAVQGQHRMSGVKYCSKECARSQAQRQYRRRKKHGPHDPRRGHAVGEFREQPPKTRR